MQNSYCYFKNEKCKYFPCHKVEKETDFNCLFCYCPLNQYEDCPGNPHFIVRESGKKIKDCTYCTFPHQRKTMKRLCGFVGEDEVREEVIDVSIYEYDEEGHMKVVREEGFQEGQASVLLPMIIKKSKRASQQS